uniref:CCHC-type domain-containing protein n=1 Tax=Tanacetum cinerariifolium TaxID=118510 RepID=A0A6L2MPS4_TANCI|nr:hypothetical protein [Tanacetum cinerariifolium]
MINPSITPRVFALDETGRGGRRTEEQTGIGGGELSIKVAKEVAEVMDRMEALMKSLTFPLSSLGNCLHTRILWYTSQRNLMIHGMVSATEPPIIQSVILKARLLIDEAVRNGSLKKSGEKIGVGKEPSHRGNVKGDNKIARTRKDCRVGPKMVTQLNAQNSTAARGVCYECGGTDHYKSACPRLNRAPRQ